MRVPVNRSGLVAWCRLCDKTFTSTVRTKSVGARCCPDSNGPAAVGDRVVDP